MNNKNLFSNERSAGVQNSNRDVSAGAGADTDAVEESGADAVDESRMRDEMRKLGREQQPELRASVELEVQAKVDSQHPDVGMRECGERLYGVTLAQEERIRAREAELDRISAQATLDDGGRAERSREATVEAFRRCNRTSNSESSSSSRESVDPRERLSRAELGRVNREAERIAGLVSGGPSRAEIGRMLADRVVEGCDMVSAVFETLESVKWMPGVILDIEEVREVPFDSVSVAGEIVELWSPSAPKIAQVGLLGDDTGLIKFTVWEKSGLQWVREGDRVELRHAKKSWFQGRCGLALTSDGEIAFPEQDRRWWQD